MDFDSIGIDTDERSGRVVALPDGTQGVAEAVKLARREGTCVLPWSLAAGTELPELPAAAVWLSTERIGGVREVAPADLVAVAGAGVPAGLLAEAAAEHGLFWPVADLVAGATTVGETVETAPGNWTLLGNLLRRSSLAIEVVLADGAVLRTGARTVKWVTGYDLRQLFIGSRGTLGIVTEATLRLDAIANREHLMARYRDDFEDLEAGGPVVMGEAGPGESAAPPPVHDAAPDGSLVLLERLKREFDPDGVLAPLAVLNARL